METSGFDVPKEMVVWPMPVAPFLIIRYLASWMSWGRLMPGLMMAASSVKVASATAVLRLIISISSVDLMSLCDPMISSITLIPFGRAVSSMSRTANQGQADSTPTVFPARFRGRDEILQDLDCAGAVQVDLRMVNGKLHPPQYGADPAKKGHAAVGLDETKKGNWFCSA